MNKKHLLTILFVLFAVTALSGCSIDIAGIHIGAAEPTGTAENTQAQKQSTAGWPENRLMTVNGIESDYREALLYLLSAKEEAELLYGDGIWDLVVDENGTTYGSLRKAQILEEFTELKIVCAHAADYDVEIYEEENSDIADYTEKFISKVGHDKLLQYNISENIVKTLYTNNTIATKVYEAVTLAVETNVSDEEARQVSLQYIFKSKYNTDDDGNSTLMSEEETEALKVKVQQLRDTAESKKDFLSYALINTDAEGAEMTVGKGDLTSELEQFVFTLTDGELSPVLETDDGFYIFKCVLAFDEEATQTRKEEIVKERQDAHFKVLFAEWKASAVIITDTEKWESINP